MLIILRNSLHRAICKTYVTSGKKIPWATYTRIRRILCATPDCPYCGILGEYGPQDYGIKIIREKNVNERDKFGQIVNRATKISILIPPGTIPKPRAAYGFGHAPGQTPWSGFAPLDPHKTPRKARKPRSRIMAAVFDVRDPAKPHRVGRIYRAERFAHQDLGHLLAKTSYYAELSAAMLNHTKEPPAPYKILEFLTDGISTKII